MREIELNYTILKTLEYTPKHVRYVKHDKPLEWTITYDMIAENENIRLKFDQKKIFNYGDVIPVVNIRPAMRRVTAVKYWNLGPILKITITVSISGDIPLIIPAGERLFNISFIRPKE